jgi:hypothetical protein
MSRKMNVYYNATLGALGGLLGWLILGLLPALSALPSLLHATVQGAVVGALIGAFVGSVEGILNVNIRQALRGLLRGVGFGLVGGALGLLLGEVALWLVGGGYAARAIGWGIFGLAVGVGEGRANRSPRKTSYGAIGGLLGGIVGGMLLEALAQISLAYQAEIRGIGLMVLGAAIGSLIALVSEALARARLKVLSGPREGREYDLDRPVTKIGRSDACDVYLPSDRGIESVHAVVRRAGGSLLVTPASPHVALLLNNVTVPSGGSNLADGDRLIVGSTRLVVRRHR